MSLFSWLRSRIKAAVLAGVQDALDALNDLSPPAEPPVVLRLDGTAEATEAEATNGRGAAKVRGR